jgi:hypothetical protein
MACDAALSERIVKIPVSDLKIEPTAGGRCPSKLTLADQTFEVQAERFQRVSPCEAQSEELDEIDVFIRY